MLIVMCLLFIVVGSVLYNIHHVDLCSARGHIIGGHRINAACINELPLLKQLNPSSVLFISHFLS